MRGDVALVHVVYGVDKAAAEKLRQTRLTIARAKKGFFGDVSQSASTGR